MKTEKHKDGLTSEEIFCFVFGCSRCYHVIDWMHGFTKMENFNLANKNKRMMVAFNVFENGAMEKAHIWVDKVLKDSMVEIV